MLPPCRLGFGRELIGCIGRLKNNGHLVAIETVKGLLGYEIFRLAFYNFPYLSVRNEYWFVDNGEIKILGRLVILDLHFNAERPFDLYVIALGNSNPELS